jgi:hypothetical protein
MFGIIVNYNVDGFGRNADFYKTGSDTFHQQFLLFDSAPVPHFNGNYRHGDPLLVMGLFLHRPDFFPFGHFLRIHLLDGDQGTVFHSDFQQFAAFPAAIRAIVNRVGDGECALSIAFGTLNFGQHSSAIPPD